MLECKTLLLCNGILAPAEGILLENGSPSSAGKTRACMGRLTPVVARETACSRALLGRCYPEWMLSPYRPEIRSQPISQRREPIAQPTGERGILCQLP